MQLNDTVLWLVAEHMTHVGNPGPPVSPTRNKVVLAMLREASGICWWEASIIDCPTNVNCPMLCLQYSLFAGDYEMMHYLYEFVGKYLVEDYTTLSGWALDRWVSNYGQDVKDRATYLSDYLISKCTGNPELHLSTLRRAMMVELQYYYSHLQQVIHQQCG